VIKSRGGDAPAPHIAGDANDSEKNEDDDFARPFGFVCHALSFSCAKPNRKACTQLNSKPNGWFL